MKIGGYARGLLSLLDAKGGKNLPEYAEQLQPTLDVRTNYLSSLAVRKQIQANVQNAGDVVAMAVPDTEQWELIGMTATPQNLSTFGTLGARLGLVSTWQAGALTATALPLAPAQGAIAAFWPARSLIYPGGSLLGCILETSAAFGVAQVVQIAALVVVTNNAT